MSIRRSFSPVIVLLSTLALAACNVPNNSEPVSASGVTKASVQVPTDANGLTLEQENIKNRLLNDNKPGAIKYLYVISLYTGTVMISATVKGKVTSGNKRLTPANVDRYNMDNTRYGGFNVDIGGTQQTTTEVLGDDGTYGSSGSYIFFWTTNGTYYQLGTEGATWVVTDHPIAVAHAVLDLDSSAAPTASTPLAPAPAATLPPILPVAKPTK